MRKDVKNNKRVATGLNIQYWTRTNFNPRTFWIDFEAVELDDDGNGWVHKILFNKTIQAAVTENPDFSFDVQNVIDRINFMLLSIISLRKWLLYLLKDMQVKNKSNLTSYI